MIPQRCSSHRRWRRGRRQQRTTQRAHPCRCRGPISTAPHQNPTSPARTTGNPIACTRTQCPGTTSSAAQLSKRVPRLTAPWSPNRSPWCPRGWGRGSRTCGGPARWPHAGWRGAACCTASRGARLSTTITHSRAASGHGLRAGPARRAQQYEQDHTAAAQPLSTQCPGAGNN